MKKNVIIGLLTIVSLLSLTYGYFQKIRADVQEAIAREALIRAEQSQKEAEMQRAIAELNAHKAMEQAEMAMKNVTDGKK